MDPAKIQQFRHYLTTGNLPRELLNTCNDTKARFRKQADKLEIKNGQLVTKATGHPVVPINSIDQSIEQIFSKVPSGARKIYQSELKGTGITREQCEKYIYKQEQWQLHRPMPRVSSIKQINASEFKERFMIDIVDMKKYAHNNLRYK